MGLCAQLIKGGNRKQASFSCGPIRRGPILGGGKERSTIHMTKLGMPLPEKTNGAPGPTTIKLMGGDPRALQQVAIIAENVDGASGSYTWTVPPNLPEGNSYAVVLGNPPEVAYSTQFTIKGAGAGGPAPPASPSGPAAPPSSAPAAPPSSAPGPSTSASPVQPAPSTPAGTSTGAASGATTHASTSQTAKSGASQLCPAYILAALPLLAIIF
ncbi:uncharacterized protein VTP21DRAFT_5970 [Calcarisporiella thermophila]|uniref:uncharacterized protein n=1 Tax=Calcarisporiella thermophila TaxID=911321 RepID=UPI003742C3D9